MGMLYLCNKTCVVFRSGGNNWITSIVVGNNWIIWIVDDLILSSDSNVIAEESWRESDHKKTIFHHSIIIFNWKMMMGSRSRNGEGRLINKPPMQPSYWKFLDEKLQFDESSVKKSTFTANLKTVSTTETRRCIRSVRHEVVVDNHKGHCSSIPTVSTCSSLRRSKSSSMTKAQSRWSPCCEGRSSSCFEATSKVPQRTIAAYPDGGFDHRVRYNTSCEDSRTTFDLDGSERSTISTNSVDISPRLPNRWNGLCDDCLR